MNDGTVKIGTELDPSGMKKGLDGLGGYAQKGYGAIGKSAQLMATVSIAAIGAISSAMIAGAFAGLKYNAQMENYMASFTTMLGNEAAALKKVEELKKLASSTPYELSDLAQGTTTLLAFGIATEKTTDNLSMLGDISLGSKDKLTRLTMAFGKASSQGKLTGETLQQMIEAGFNPLKVISETTGETIEQLTNRMSRGGISADEMTAAFKKATSVGGQFYKGMETASKTTDGMISTLKDNAKALLGEVMEPISKTIKDKLLPSAIKAIDKLTKAFARDGVPGLIKAIKDIAPAMAPFIDLSVWIIKNAKTIAKVLGVMAAAYVGYNAALIAATVAQKAHVAMQVISNARSIISALVTGGEAAAKVALTGATGSATAAQWLLNAAMAANPAGLLIAAVLALGAAFVIFGDHSNEALEKAKKITESTKELTSALAESEQAYEDQAKKMSFNGEHIQKLSDELYELEAIENKSADQKARMSSLVGQLNELMPDLNLEINKQTGALNKNKKATDQLIASQLKQIKQEAAKTRLAEIYEEGMDAAFALAEATDALTEAQNRNYEAVNTTMTGFGSAETNKIATVYLYQQAVDEATAAMAKNAEQALYAEGITSGYMTTVIDANGQVIESEGETSKAVQDSLSEQALARKEFQEDLQKKTKEHFDEMGTIYDNGIAAEKISAAESKANMDQQILDEQGWLENLKGLARKVSPEVMAYLKELGPSARYLIADLNNGTEEALGEWVDTFEEKGALAEEAATTTFDGIYQAYGDPYETFKGLGKSSIDGLIAGMNNSSGGAYTAAHEMAKGIAAAYASKQKIKSPSRVFMKLAEHTTSPLITNMDDTTQLLAQKMRKMGGVMSGNMIAEMQRQAIGRGQGLASGATISVISPERAGEKMDYDRMALANAAAMSKVRFDMDGQTAGRITAPYTDSELGSMSELKLRYA